MMKRILQALLVSGALWSASGAAGAQAATGFSVVYDIHAKGITAGLFSYSVARSGDTYQATADRKMTGLVRSIVGSKQDYHYTAMGTVSDKGPQPASYQHSGGKKGRVVQVSFTPDDITTVANPGMGMGNPPATREQKIGAIDQLSSIYAMAITAGDPCARTLHIYLDGRSRFDLVMSPSGSQRVSSRAFKGSAKRCSVAFKPIAGFDDPIEPATLTFLFAPIGGLYAPIKIAMPTDDAGIVTLEARSFAIAKS